MRRLCLATAVFLSTFTALALAAPSNGGFESGTFQGWNTRDEEDSEMVRSRGTGEWQVYSGKLRPAGEPPGEPVHGPVEPLPTLQRPPQGEFAAGLYSDAPGRHVLHRVLEADGRSVLSLELALNNTAEEFIAPNSFNLERPNQQLRIDLMKPDAPLFSLESGDIIETIFRTRAGDDRTQNYTRIKETVDGGKFRLRIAEVDNQAPFLVGVDDVTLTER